MATQEQLANFNTSVEAFLTSLTVNVIVGSAFVISFLILRPVLPFVFSPKTSRKVASWKSALKEPALSVWLPKILMASDQKIMERGGIDGSMIYGIHKLLKLALKTHHFHPSDPALSFGRRSVLIRDIPHNQLSESQLHRTFSQIGVIESVVLVKKNAELASLIDKLDTLRDSLERGAMVFLRELLHKNKLGRLDQGTEASEPRESTDFVEADESKLELHRASHTWSAVIARPRRRVGWFNRRTVDWLDDDQTKYREVAADVERERLALETAAPDSSAFVVFESEVAANLALAAVVLESPTAMRERHLVMGASNIVWTSLNYTYAYRGLMKIAAFAGVCALVLLWAVIVLTVSSFASLDSIYRVFPFLALVELSPVVRGFLTGFLPTLAVSILLSLVPTLLRIVSHLEGEVTLVSIDRSVLARQYFFLTFNVLLIVTVSKSVWDSLYPILNSPLSTISILAKSIPPASSFYINYVMLQALTGPTAALLQIGNLITRSINVLGLLGTNTPHSIKMALKPTEWDFPAIMALHSLIATIGLTYATLSPLVLLFVSFFVIFFRN
ncbi:hypothetical protein HK096_011487 [Nowakowskiella sp. JEL0078]|nr:hypothetical protein HK096_011487 [Nowakowskiella sp. JEL0078]